MAEIVVLLFSVIKIEDCISKIVRCVNTVLGSVFDLITSAQSTSCILFSQVPD